MNETEWNRAANISGIASLISIVLFLWRLMTGTIDLLTVIFFALVITGAVAYILIRMIIMIRKTTPQSFTISDQVSETREFVAFFITEMVMLGMAITILIFGSNPAGKVTSSLLFVYTLVATGIKIYDIQRLTTSKTAHIQLVHEYNFTRFSMAERVGFGLIAFGFILMFFVPVLSVVSYIGGLTFLVRPFNKHVDGKFIDVFLVALNGMMIIFSLLLMLFK